MDYLYDDFETLPFSYEPNYQQFISRLRKRLIKRNEYILSYEFLKGSIREELSDLFLSDEAPKKLRELFYTRSLSLRNLQDNPDWIPYLENVDLRLVLSYNMTYYSDSIDKFYKLFGEKANKLIVHKASTIDDMFIREKVDLMYDWYLKTGRTFIPSSVVMLNFDFNDADKFFEYRKDWAVLAKNPRYSFTNESLEALLRLSYVFGVFDGDKSSN